MIARIIALLVLRFWDKKHHGTCRYHAIVQGCAGHYQDLRFRAEYGIIPAVIIIIILLVSLLILISININNNNIKFIYIFDNICIIYQKNTRIDNIS